MASSVDRNDNERIITTEVQGVSRGIKKKPFTFWVKGLTPKGGECVATAVTTRKSYITPPAKSDFSAS